jgi:hypothetical protein
MSDYRKLHYKYPPNTAALLPLAVLLMPPIILPFAVNDATDKLLVVVLPTSVTCCKSILSISPDKNVTSDSRLSIAIPSAAISLPSRTV